MELSNYNLSVEDVARRLNYSSWSVRRLARLGAIPGVKRVRAWFFREADLSAILTHNNREKNNGFRKDRKRKALR